MSSMGRFKHTIILALILALGLAFLLWRAGSADDCEGRGGHYVETFRGWECVDG